MNTKPKRYILIFGIMVILVLYPISYITLLQTVPLSGGGSTQRIPHFKNPFTGNSVDDQKPLLTFYNPMLKLDKLLRPEFWISYTDNSLNSDQ